MKRTSLCLDATAKTYSTTVSGSQFATTLNIERAFKSDCHSRVASTVPSIHDGVIRHLWTMNHWIIHNLREKEGRDSLKPWVSSGPCSVHSHMNERDRGREKEKWQKNPRFDATHKGNTRSRVNVVVTLKVVWRVCAGTGCLYLTFSFLGDSRTHVNQITVIRLSLWRASFAHCLDVPSGRFARIVLFFAVVRSFTRVSANPHLDHLTASGLERWYFYGYFYTSSCYNYIAVYENFYLSL